MINVIILKKCSRPNMHIIHMFVCTSLDHNSYLTSQHKNKLSSDYFIYNHSRMKKEKKCHKQWLSCCLKCMTFWNVKFVFAFTMIVLEGRYLEMIMTIFLMIASKLQASQGYTLTIQSNGKLWWKRTPNSLKSAV